MRYTTSPGTALLALALLVMCLGAKAETMKADVPSAVVQGNNQFALDLYTRLSQQEGNLFFSPYSLSTALAMTATGARGETAQQMLRTLHLPEDPARLNAGFASLIKQLQADAKTQGYELRVANALWGQKGYSFLDDFLSTLKTDYRAGFEGLDFRAAAEQARTTINRWVEKQTADKIRDLIPSGALNADTRLVLTNAIYFKGAWASPFLPQQTSDAPFTASGGRNVNVPMMNQRSRFGYADLEGLQLLELPYKGGDLSMVVLLPRQVDGLAALEKDLSLEKLIGSMAKLTVREVKVSLPRYKLTQGFGLRSVLSEMGMPLAFSDSADFSGMTGRKELSISAVIHKAFVDVNEEGTEAAGASGVAAGVKAMPVAVPTFRADHPFLFLIRDTRSGSILFLGRLAQPQDR